MGEAEGARMPGERGGEQASLVEASLALEPEALANLSEEASFALYAHWARLVAAAPAPALEAAYGEALERVTDRLHRWIALADTTMYREPAHADALLTGLRGVRGAVDALRSDRDLDLAELFFLEITGAVGEAEALHAALVGADPGDPRPAVERAAARLFPCRPGVAPDVPGAIALLEGALLTVDPAQESDWDLRGRLDRLRRGLPWEDGAA